MKMNKKLLLAVVMILAVFVTSAFVVTEKEVAEMEVNPKVVELEPYIVQLTSIGLGLESCSGVVLSNEVNNTTVLTCKHCIAPSFEMYADDVKVSTIHTTSKEDLAYLILEEPIEGKKAATIATYRPGKETKINMLGRPGMAVTYFKTGKILKYTDNWGFAQLDVIGGCSGTGIFNEDNELVGIVWGAYKEGTEGGSLFSPGEGGVGIGIFEPLYDIQDFLRNIHKALK
jgi:hypothetical protein